jgi:hypothetical protein
MLASERLAQFKANQVKPVAALVESVFVPEGQEDAVETALKAIDGVVDGAKDQDYKVFDLKQLSGRKCTGTAIGYASNTQHKGKIKISLTGSLMGQLDAFPGITR